MKEKFYILGEKFGSPLFGSTWHAKHAIDPHELVVVRVPTESAATRFDNKALLRVSVLIVAYRAADSGPARA